MSKTSLTNINNYLADTRPPDEQWKDKVNKKLFVESKQPKNAMMTTAQVLNYTSSDFDLYGRISSLVPFGDGFFGLIAEEVNPNFVRYVYQPLSFGSNNVNNIKLSINVSILYVEGAGFFPTTADSSYSVDFYFSILFPATFENFVITANELSPSGSSFPFQRTMIAKGVINYDLAEDKFTLSNFPYFLNLNDTITRVDEDFTTNPTKITQEQYDILINNDCPIYINVGYDRSQALALTGNNLIHFNEYFVDASGGVSPEPIPAFQANYALNFTYFGTTTNFKPKS